MAANKSGYIVAAAFIGPGTVTTASLAGANFGFHLVWALLFSIVATMVLQDMAARLGLGTGKGLSDALVKLTHHRVLRIGIAALIVSAVGIGNAAYESGNLTGAAIGLNAIVALGTAKWAIVLGILAALLLLTGKYKLIETVLVGLVATMALVFVVTLLFASPDWSAMFNQLITPRLDSQTITMVLALIGTTIVPYNLFLHASLVAREHEAEKLESALTACRKQSFLAIGFGGVITLVIVATAMTAFFGQSEQLDAGNMGKQLAPVLGDSAQWFFAAGLFAAGLTSAITAPLAASYAVCGALGKSADMSSPLFKMVWATVIVCGVAVASLGVNPLIAILFAQATNGLLLPIIAVFLLVAMNNQQLATRFRNSTFSNAIGTAIVLFVVLLGTYKLWGLLAR